MMSLMKMNEYVAIQEKICEKNDYIAPRLYDEYGVNRGLRDDRCARAGRRAGVERRG